MSARDILSYFFTTVSFITITYSAFSNNTRIYTCLLVLLALSSFLFLTTHLMFNQNKMHTLYVLSRENRSFALQLLLTYEELKYSRDDLSEKFCTSKIHAKAAHYVYEIIPANDLSRSDLKCTFTFEIKNTIKGGVFDILIAQPRGVSLTTIKYKFSDTGKEYVAKAKIIKFQKDQSDSPRLLKAQVSLNNGQKGIKALIVSFTFEKAYSTHNGAFLLCPFIYAKRVDCFDVQIKYPEDPRYWPGTADLKLYPYNGKKFQPMKIVDLLRSDDTPTWAIAPTHCVTNAIYIIETHGAPNNH